MTGRRGSTLLMVVAVLAILSILLHLAVSLLVSRVETSRRRMNVLYAGELAKSGVAWARACLEARLGGCAHMKFDVAGGTIEVTVDEGFSGGHHRVTSMGTSTLSGEPAETRVEEVEVFSE